MVESNARNGSRRYVAVVIFLMFIAIATMTSATILSVFVEETTILIQLPDGSTIKQSNHVSQSIEKLWQGLFSSLSALIGLLGGKVL